MSKHVTQAEYARMKGWDRSHVTRLKARGRIVLTAEHLVDVEATEARLADSETAARKDVAHRHADNRRMRAGIDAEPVDDRAGVTPANAGRMKTFYEALKVEREHAVACGDLVDRIAANEALANAIAIFRVRLDAMPDQLTAAILVERDETRLKILLTDFKDELLTELSREFAALAKESAHAPA